MRDGRDCAQSHRSKHYLYGYENVLRVALEWREQVTLCHKMGAMLPPERFFELRYEDLLAEPTAELSRLCAFLNLPFSPLMLEYPSHVEEHVPQDRRSLWPLLDRPPIAANAFKWKSDMSSGDRAVFERNAGDLLRTFGYETSKVAARQGKLLELWYLLHSKLAWRIQVVKRFFRQRLSYTARSSMTTAAEDGKSQDAR